MHISHPTQRYFIIFMSRDVHNKGLRDLYFLPDTIRVIKWQEGEMGRAHHMHGREMHTGFWMKTGRKATTWKT